MRLQTAIKCLKENYELAKKNKYVKDKVARALYLTWRQVEMIADSQRYKAETKEGDGG